MILGFKTVFPWGKPTRFVDKIISEIKIHSIREDQHGRWKPGRSIQFATGVRTKSYNQFLEGECKSTQKITISPERWVKVDDRELSWTQTCDLAERDGFDSVDEFFRWFRDYGLCTLTLIHWTDFKY